MSTHNKDISHLSTRPFFLEICPPECHAPFRSICQSLCLYDLYDAPDDLLNASLVSTGKNVTLFPGPSGSIRDPGCPNDQFSPLPIQAHDRHLYSVLYSSYPRTLKMHNSLLIDRKSTLAIVYISIPRQRQRNVNCKSPPPHASYVLPHYN